MNDLISGEALLDDEEEDESSDEDGGRRPRGDRPDRMDDSSEEEDDDDEEEARRIRDGFIVDEEEEDEEEANDSDAREREHRRKKKRRRQEREEEEQLDDEDLDLIGEANPSWEQRPSTTHQFKRLKRGHRDENERGRGNGLAEMFSDEDDEDDGHGYGRTHRAQGDELDDFIEDDYPEDDEERNARMEEMEVSRANRDRPGFSGGVLNTTGLDPEALEDMENIFGNGEDYDWAIQMEEEEEERQRETQNLELKDVFEPSQLHDKMLTEEDNEIRWADEPERFQLDRKPFANLNVTEAQFREEARWITSLMWPKKKLSGDLYTYFHSAVRRVLEFFIVDAMEVPYIFQHKKDYLIHDRKRARDGNDDGDEENTEKLLNQDDLWRILELDIKFRSLLEKRNALEKTYETVKSISGREDPVLDEMIPQAETMEELQDLQDYANFQFAAELRDAALANNTKGTKRPGQKTTLITRVRESMAYEFVKAYGLSATQLALNALKEGKKVSAEDHPKMPIDLADELTDMNYHTGEQVLHAARQMFAEELTTNPRMRKAFRAAFFAMGEFSCRRTEKGLRKIDEQHPYYEIKYLINQSINDMARRPEVFLKMMKAEEEGLIEIQLKLEHEREFKRQLAQDFQSENFSELADAWNEERNKVLDLAFPKLEKQITRAVKDALRTACQEDVLKVIRSEYTRRLDQAPYKPKGLVLGTVPRVLAFSNGMGDVNRDPIHWAWVEEDGRMVENGTFVNLARDETQRAAFVDLVQRLAPDVIGVSGFSADTHRLVRDVENIVKDKNLMVAEYEDEHGEYRTDIIEVVVVNDEVARLYKDSSRGLADYPTAHPLTRYCVGLAKYMQSPLKEYAALGKDISTIHFHACQHLLPADRLMRYLDTAMIDMVNLVGIDINEALSDPYVGNLLPYIAGLGPRKALGVIKTINSYGGHVSSREDLVGDADTGRMPVVGPRVFNNCASFLHIEYDPTNRNSDPLDSTRVHPEDYELGRKMAADALELYDEDVKAETDENGPAAIIRMLFRNEDQDKVNDLVLEEYAEQLESKFQQRKRATLEIIRAELLMPYEELRRQLIRMEPDDIFRMFTGESKDSLYKDMVVAVNVRLVKDDFAIVKLDCGIEGRIEAHDVPHRHSVKDALQIGSTVRAKILDLNRKDFMAKLSMRDEAMRRGTMGGPRIDRHSRFWDIDLEEKDRETLQVKDKVTGRAQRVIKHPLFKPFNATQAEEFLGSAPVGDAVIRPSSQGPDHIAVTWKVATGVMQHLDVLELEKENEFSVGKKLRVQNTQYSDLDELIVEHVKAMAKKVEEMTRSDKFHAGSKSDLDRWLSSYIQANPSRSNYGFCIDTKHPGYFQLCFKSGRNSPVNSWPVRVIPQGFTMRGNKYPDMRALCNGFKILFNVEAQKMMQGRK